MVAVSGGLKQSGSTIIVAVSGGLRVAVSGRLKQSSSTVIVAVTGKLKQQYNNMVTISGRLK